MTLKNKAKDFTVFFTMLLLVMSNAKLFDNLGIGLYFEYGAYFLLLCGIAVSFLFSKKPARYIVEKVIIFLVVSLLFSIGIAVQDLALITRLQLIATMLIISAVALLAEDYLSSLHTIRVAAYGLFAGTLVTTALSLVTGTSILEYVYEGMLRYGITGGVLYKNFYAAFLLGSFIGLFYYNRYVEKIRMDQIIMKIQAVLILLSGAKGTYIFLGVFLILAHLAKLGNYLLRFRVCRWALGVWNGWKKPYRVLFIAAVCVAGVLMIALAFAILVTVSDNYAIRFRGVVRYWHYVKHNPFRVIFGNAAQVWADPTVDYVSALRALVGKHTSYEMAFLNTFIKNGVLGLIGFAVLFAYLAFTACKVGTKQGKRMIFVIMFVLLLSSLVESFATNVHSIFGIVCYLYMSGLTGMCRREQKE